MNLYTRGLAWLALYLALVGLPAAVAVLVDPIPSPRSMVLETSVGLGLFAYPLVMIQFALVSHLGASSRPFGTDALIQFHQYVGVLCVVLVVGHPLLLSLQGLSWTSWSPFSGSPTTRSGAVATLAIAGLAVTTVWRRRLRLGYETWQRLHLGLAIIAAGASLWHVLVAGGYARAAPLGALLVLYAGVAGATVVNYRALRPLRMARRPWTLLENRDAGASTRVLRLRPDGHPGFAFEPGQFAWLVTGASPWSSQSHPLSIASSAERAPGGAIEFAIKAVGDWSSVTVPALPAGARVWVEGPFGAFTLDRRAAQGFVLIAGGSGIVPFRSMLLTMRDRGDRRHVVLIYAARDASRAIFRDELAALGASMAIEVVFVYEAPGADWQGERGLITPDLLQRHLPPQFRRYGYFICGPAAMMDEVEPMLTGLGVPRGAIDTERFDVV